MRAARILAARPERAIVALAELCEERKDEGLVVAPPYNSRPPTLPPQTPYTVGSQTLRPKVAERFSPPAQFFEPGPRQVVQPVTLRPPPEHMAPKRGKWTSPPPPEASSADHTMFENQLGIGLQLATSSTDARENDNSSESNSEIYTDEGSDIAEDDIKSVRSYTEGSSNIGPGISRRPSWHIHDTARPPPPIDTLSPGLSSRSSSHIRGRFPQPGEKGENLSPVTGPRHSPEIGQKSDFARRTLSTRLPPKVPMLFSSTQVAVATPLPASPASPLDSRFSDSSNVFYQTTTTRSPRPTALYPSHGTHPSLLSHYQPYAGQVPHDILPAHLPPSLSSSNPRAGSGNNTPGRSYGGPDTPTPTSYSSLHKHSLSSTTITAPTPPPSASRFPSQSQYITSPLTPQDTQFLQTEPGSSQHIQDDTRRSLGQSVHEHQEDGSLSHLSPGNVTGSSPSPPSSNGYSTSISRSPSPHSPCPPPTAVPSNPNGDQAEITSSFSSLTLTGDGEPVAGISAAGLVVEFVSTEEKES